MPPNQINPSSIMAKSEHDSAVRTMHPIARSRLIFRSIRVLVAAAAVGRQTNINFDERFPVGQSEQFIVNCAESLLRHIFSRDNQGTCATGNILAEYLCIIRGCNDAAFE